MTLATVLPASSIISEWSPTGAPSSIPAIQTDDGDLSYISTSTIGLREGWTFSALGIDPNAKVNFVRLLFKSRVESGTPQLQVKVGPPGNLVSIGVFTPPAGDYGNVVIDLVLNPITGLPWSVNEADSLGVELTLIQPGVPRITYALKFVDYTLVTTQITLFAQPNVAPAGTPIIFTGQVLVSGAPAPPGTGVTLVTSTGIILGTVPTDQAGNFSMQWNTSGLNPGTYQVQARALGGESSWVTVTIQGALVLSLNLDKTSYVQGEVIRVTGSLLSDGTPVTGMGTVDLLIDGQLISTASVDTGFYSASLNSSGLSIGGHQAVAQLTGTQILSPPVFFQIVSPSQVVDLTPFIVGAVVIGGIALLIFIASRRT